MAEIAFDPFARSTGEIPWEQMAELRRRQAVIETPSGFYYLTRYADCRRVLVDSRTFANEGGMRAPGIVVPREERMINEMDPPDHTRLRKLQQSTLNQTTFREVRPFIDKLARGLIDGLARGEEVDLVLALTGPVPGVVAAHIIGVPEEDYLRFRAWGEEVVRGPWVAENRTPRGEGLHGGHPEFSAYIDDIVASRRNASSPPDDLITRMVQAEVDGQRMTDTEIRIAVAHLIIAGNETTTNLLGNAFYRLIADPALYARVRDDRSLLPALVEESLRYDPPVMLLMRTCTRDVEIGGVEIPQGERVMIGMASANRDEEAFGPDAESFRVDRVDPPPQLTFGFGPHLCLGADLARIEGVIVGNALLDNFERAELAPGYRFTGVPSFWELGPLDLPVRLFR